MTPKKNESDIMLMTGFEAPQIPECLGTAYVDKKLSFTPMSFNAKQGDYVKIVAAYVHLGATSFMNAKMNAMNIISDSNIQLDAAALMNTQIKSLILLGKNISLDGATLMNSTVNDIYINAEKLTFEDATFFNLPNLSTLNIHAKRVQCKDNLELFPTPNLKNIWLNNVAYPTLAAMVRDGR